MIRSVKSLALLLLAFAGGLALADDGSLRRYELPNLDTLELALPAGWQDELAVQARSEAIQVLEDHPHDPASDDRRNRPVRCRCPHRRRLRIARFPR